ncbi:hypothetical protein IEQ34_006869 [Dendrobium chrysotoxum]|uniref:Uncharacterized protein n=1 Tax=Dendrobium chrysotoxum TaxID=161865 RepID=A0AAV7H808_DENCH|nr:hypothetical protein IEQ34_006869 [Dendrobium chrysotoxum]
MILGSGMEMPMTRLALNVRTRRRGLPVILASANKGVIRVDIEQLRHQIDQLHAQAEITRSKANNARLRLMRLSEAAENLQRRAVLEVARSMENEARELLMQKKKLLQALERTKRRLEVLDELSMKINEAISLKETQLIGNVTLFPEINKEDSGQEIRIISPKNFIDKDEKTTDIYDFEHTKPCDEEGIETVKQDIKQSFDQELQNCEDDAIGTQGSGSMMSDLRAISSYEEFLEHIDGQLRQAELDICNFLRLSTMIWESKQRQMNLKVQHISDILDHDCESHQEKRMKTKLAKDEQTYNIWEGALVSLIFFVFIHV